MSTEFVIEVHNLKNENDTILKNTIQKVFKNKLGVDISVDKLDIEDWEGTKTATLYLKSIDEAHAVARINTNGFKFTQIAKKSKSIYVNRVKSKRPVHVYEYEEYIGDETRQREFKKGGGDIKRTFLRTGEWKRCFAHYACGIVNNREKGSVYIGVNDEGKVEGIKCNHGKRDKIRRRIAQTMMSDLKPSLTTIHYSVNFTPVRSKDGHFQVDMFVLEITLYPVDKFDKLYRVKDGVYQKSDACLLGPLAEAAIKEWEDQIRYKHLKEEQNTELQELNEKYDQLIATTEEKEKTIIEEKDTEIDKLKREKSELVKENKKLIQKSKTCVIL